MVEGEDVKCKGDNEEVSVIMRGAGDVNCSSRTHNLQVYFTADPEFCLKEIVKCHKGITIQCTDWLTQMYFFHHFNFNTTKKTSTVSLLITK